MLLSGDHNFVTGESLGFGPGSVLHTAHVCRNCGVIRRADGQNKPCRGVVRVTTREGNHAPIDGHQSNTGSTYA